MFLRRCWLLLGCRQEREEEVRFTDVPKSLRLLSIPATSEKKRRRRKRKKILFQFAKPLAGNKHKENAFLECRREEGSTLPFLGQMGTILQKRKTNHGAIQSKKDRTKIHGGLDFVVDNFNPWRVTSWQVKKSATLGKRCTSWQAKNVLKRLFRWQKECVKILELLQIERQRKELGNHSICFQPAQEQRT